MRRGVKSGSLGAESWERGQLMHDLVSSSNIISNTRGETRHHCPPPLLWCHRCHPSHVFDVTLVLQRWFFTLLVRYPLQRVFMVVSICLDFNRIIPGSPKWRKYIFAHPHRKATKWCFLSENWNKKAKNGFWRTSQDVSLEDGTDLESDERWWWEWRCFHSNAMWQSASGLQATTTTLLSYHHSSTTTSTTSTNTTIPTPLQGGH